MTRDELIRYAATVQAQAITCKNPKAAQDLVDEAQARARRKAADED